ncbi:O-methyltransferase [Frankia canadensis]|uniref:O-methyltransferase n=1 Tax=Frankia canadensis TaxID=1836972 RepID=A0A2I2KXG2_9ACTN|nr:methyltransferase [Frankia canadensis]SNQ50351.1 O-methyltransferase [Frankia canadensis]SOU57641.1 O-methyltransferase [Frankia canadensis]
MALVKSTLSVAGGSEGPSPITLLRDLSLASAVPAALRTVLRIRLADEIGDTPVPIDQLAKGLDVDAAVLERLLRNLRSYGVFEETAGGIAHTPTSRLLREDDPHSLRNWVLWVTEPWVWELWPDLEEAVRTGRGHFDERYGAPFFTHLHREWQESTEVFNRSQTELSRITSDAIAESLDLSGVKTFADVGGGRGYTLSTILEHHPHLHGTLVDLPAAVANPDPRLRADGALAGRSRVVAGSCLEEIPVEADVYQFKSILEWDDELTVTALRNAVRAGRPGSRVLVITNLVDDSPEIRYATGIDLLFLLNTNGRRHTRAGVSALVERAGLRLEGVTAVHPLLHVVETTIPG